MGFSINVRPNSAASNGASKTEIGQRVREWQRAARKRRPASCRNRRGCRKGMLARNLFRQLVAQLEEQFITAQRRRPRSPCTESIHFERGFFFLFYTRLYLHIHASEIDTYLPTYLYLPIYLQAKKKSSRIVCFHDFPEIFSEKFIQTFILYIRKYSIIGSIQTKMLNKRFYF